MARTSNDGLAVVVAGAADSDGLTAAIGACLGVDPPKMGGVVEFNSPTGRAIMSGPYDGDHVIIVWGAAQSLDAAFRDALIQCLNSVGPWTAAD
jgi:hypothetical protein